MEHLVSVIVPIYRVEQYLQRCVSSIQQQTHQHLEIILVDDGSPDQCPALCDELAAWDPRIRVIHQPNGGLSAARNAGIDRATGEYLLFVDSDDYIAKTMVEDMLAAALAHGVKLVLANFCCVSAEGERVFAKEESPICDEVCLAEELLPKLYERLGWYYIVAWNKLYHRSLFAKLRFPVGRIHEDEFVVTQVMCLAGRVACLSAEEYVYIYQRPGSIMSTQLAKKHCHWLEALALRYEFCKLQGLDAFAAETRAVYFRELNNLFLKPELKQGTTRAQRVEAKRRYGRMEHKTGTERVNWLLFRISPRLERLVVEKVRRLR